MDNTNAILSDYQIMDPIEDTIQQIRFYPGKSSNMLATCGWDSAIRVWQYNYSLMNNGAQIQTNLVFNTKQEDPLLSLCWKGEQFNIISGCANGSIFDVDLNTATTNIIGKHELGVKQVAWVNNLNVVLSAGWDGKLNFWDTRQPNPILSFSMDRKIFTMSLSFPLLVVGMNDRQVAYFNLNKLQMNEFKPEVIFESHLKHQTRCISTFPDATGYAIGSIEGRVAIKYVDLNKMPNIAHDTKTMSTNDDFAFRCHRIESEVYPVNDIAFNQPYGTFCTGGGEGSWTIWDKDSRSRLKSGNFQNRCPITALDYSPNGDILAYAAGYDWAKGIGFENTFQPQIKLHYCTDLDKKKKPKK